MLFSDLVNSLLSRGNCALFIKYEGGTVLIQNLHRYVRYDAEIVHGIKDKHNSVRAKMIKENLQYIVDNFDAKHVEKHVVGFMPKRKK